MRQLQEKHPSACLKFGSCTMISEEGVQQGDPLGPLLFCISVHDLLTSLSSKLSIAYLDDFTLGGSASSVNEDVNIIMSAGPKLGLHLNTSKCEVLGQKILLSGHLSQFKILEHDSVSLLGAPLFTGVALDSALSIDILKTITAHDALIILRASFSASKISYIVHCSPCSGHSSLFLMTFWGVDWSRSSIAISQTVSGSRPVYPSGMVVLVFCVLLRLHLLLL